MMDATTLTGAELFAEQLRTYDYEVIQLPDHHIKIPYIIDVGKYMGLELEIGFVVPEDFPMTPPSGPHIHKLIHPNKSGGEHPTGGVHSSSGHSQHFGPDWQYWSRPYPNWTAGPRTTVRYMEFIRGLWASQ